MNKTAISKLNELKEHTGFSAEYERLFKLGANSQEIGTSRRLLAKRNINHVQPSVEHYTRLIPEPIEVINTLGLSCNIANTIKYLARAEFKYSEKGDIQKAIDYIKFEIEFYGDYSELGVLEVNSLLIKTPSWGSLKYYSIIKTLLNKSEYLSDVIDTLYSLLEDSTTDAHHPMTTIGKMTNWQVERGLDTSPINIKNETSMLFEEIYELCGFEVHKSKREMFTKLLHKSMDTIVSNLDLPYTEPTTQSKADALFDLMEISVGGMAKMNLVPELVCLEGLKEINSRKGTLINGKFQKFAEGEAGYVETYQADYSSCFKKELN